MKRPPGLWILLSAGFLWLSFDDVDGVKATSLIFGKSTTTTTTEQTEIAKEEEVTTTETVDANSTKPILTGNPQLDYVWDPNLPKELNGYNLSDYPFYERVPENIKFKCDGLHDGFYASVQHKCQVYHHCLFGTRYDFLCANYTAFDQKTFICHFASEVDCANSKKFWHRNDALYKSASTTTTTTKPFVIYTPPPQHPLAADQSPSPPKDSSLVARRPYGGQRRPFRRRPQYDYYDDEYYDDYYEDRPRSNRGRKRPRPRPRPYYEDEYDDEYEDERYERRGVGRRNEKRRPYERTSAGRRRNKERAKVDYDDESDDRFQDDDYRLSARPKNKERKRDPDYAEDSQERKYSRRYYGNNDKRNRKPTGSAETDSVEYDDPPRSHEKLRSKGETRQPTNSNSRPVIKPLSGTIYDKPRVAPKVKPPVPKNEAERYAYKPISTVESEPERSDEYDDDRLSSGSAPTRKPTGSKERPYYRNRDQSTEKPKHSTSTPKRLPSYDSYEASEEKDSRQKKPEEFDEEYYDDYEDEDMGENDKNVESTKAIPTTSKPKSTTFTTTTTTTTTTSRAPSTSTTEAPVERLKEPLIRLVKRPFLPSRGGNPFAPRGLQPVGARALSKTPEESQQESESKVMEYGSKEDDTRDTQGLPLEEKEPVFKPSPVLIKVSPGSTLASTQKFQERTTQPPKTPEKNPLDINEDEYDVTLNDALNPTLPNLPVRGFPTGFSASSRDYTYSTFQRPRNGDQNLAPASYEYVYEAKPQRQRFQIIPETNVREQFVHSSADFKGQYSVINENYRPRQVQQTQAYFPKF